MRKRTFLMALVVLLSSLFLVQPAYAAGYQPPFEVQSEAVYLVNLDTGDVIYEKNADKKMYPASITKLMTAILAYENVEDFDNTVVTAKGYIYDELYGLNGSTADILRGEQVNFTQLMYGMLVQSGNEAASIVADYIGDGSIPYFVEMMNEKAAELGCEGTHYANPHGLFDEENYTTAKDVYKIAKYASEIPGLMEVVCTTSCNIGPSLSGIERHEEWWLNTTNKMMVKGTTYYYEPIRGMKTGTLAESGKCFVSTATQDGYNYMCVILGAPFVEDENGNEIDNIAFKETKQFYEWVFDTFRIKTLVEKNVEITEVPVKLSGDTDHIMLAPKERFNALVPDEIEPSSVIIDFELPEYVEAPVKKGDYVGLAHLQLAGEELGTIELVATQSADRSTILYVISQIQDLMASFWFKFVVVFLITFFVLYIILMVLRNRNMRRYRNVHRPKQF